LLAEFRARMQKKQQSESSSNSDSIRDSGKKQPPTGVGSLAKDNNHSLEEEEEEEEETPKKEKRRKSVSKTTSKKQQTTNDEDEENNDDDNDSMTDDSSEVSDPSETPSPPQCCPDKRLDKSLMADSSSEEDEQDTRRARAKPRPKSDAPAHNPITLMRQQQQHVPIQNDEDVPTENGASLWSDSENEQEPEPDTKKKTKKRGKKQSKEKKKQKSTDSCRERAAYSTMVDTSQEDAETRQLLRLDEEILRQTLKPEFAEPRFGPFDLEPLVLKGETRGIEYKVPTSMNRYLLPYQREGVVFLYNALSARKGAILGDEMVSLPCCLIGWHSCALTDSPALFHVFLFSPGSRKDCSNSVSIMCLIREDRYRDGCRGAASSARTSAGKGRHIQGTTGGGTHARTCGF
jgi:hypothetical protein